MADTEAVQVSPAPARRTLTRRTIVVLGITAVIVAGVITTTCVSVANAAAAETARECSAALKARAISLVSVPVSLEEADHALANVKSVVLPGGEGWKSASYANRPGADAVEVAPAGDGVAAVDAKPSRASGASLVNAVVAGRAALARVTIPTKCATRDQAVKINDMAAASVRTAKALGGSVTTLVADFTTFQTEEHARVAAEVAAKKAAEEAARQAAAAAAAEAARQAAAAEAARQAAARSSNSGGGHGSGSGGGYRPPAPRGSTGTPGGGGGMIGGGVGSGGPTGCVTSNGMGGTTSC